VVKHRHQTKLKAPPRSSAARNSHNNSNQHPKRLKKRETAQAQKLTRRLMPKQSLSLSNSGSSLAVAKAAAAVVAEVKRATTNQHAAIQVFREAVASGSEPRSKVAAEAVAVL
jgi:hypothetical protein